MKPQLPAERLPETLGKRIAYYRHKRGFSQEEMGKLLGIRQSSISGWETDTTPPKLANLRALADLLGVPVAMLV